MGMPELATAVVAQAAKDYREAWHRLKKKPESVYLRNTIQEIEGFFLSDWLMTLTDMDGKAMPEQLKREVAKK